MSNRIQQPGTLVHYRNRDWMVLPSDDADLLRIKPMGGSDDEITAVFLPLEMPNEKLSSASFPDPTSNEIGSFETAKLLFDASRLSFRNPAGPFRCMGKLSFSPRSYQLVPMVMALKQETVRLMIADDVGIGKTIEALLILRELMERGEIKRFAVICPPHLCEQWQKELKDKLDIDAEIIRSSNAARLDRMVPDDRSVFYHIPFQVISVDYIKSDKRRGIFLNDCPELVIVDEAHTCSLPSGAKSPNQQQRYNILHDVAAVQSRHLLLLTATPHSGKDAEFKSLLGLLKPEFKTLDFDHMDVKTRKNLAKYFIQRKRENIKKWLNQDTSFPDRDSKEVGYDLSDDFKLFYNELIQFARLISSNKAKSEQAQLLRSWAALALVKGAMSSPEMAKGMLARRKDRIQDQVMSETGVSLADTCFEDGEFAGDAARKDLLDEIELKAAELSSLEMLRKRADSLVSKGIDQKMASATKIIRNWIKEGFNPIVFCHYIDTARYVSEILRSELPQKVNILLVTSELPDEARKEKIESIEPDQQTVLVATDCMSEGINLQRYFNAVLHYDLPWNPNRLEQREGRVDRFGQTAKLIKTYLLRGVNNPMDDFIMDVLITKVRDIQRSTGVSITIGENSKSLMTEAARKILFDVSVAQGVQQRLFKESEETITAELENAKLKAEKIKSVFAQDAIDPVSIQQDLQEVDEAIGDMQTVAGFVLHTVQHFGGSWKPDGVGYKIQLANLPEHLLQPFGGKQTIRVVFDSQVPQGFTYIGRNHLFVELLCQFVLAMAFDPREDYQRIARVCEIQTDTVQSKTTMVMFRVRNVIKEVASTRETVAEEMYLWGYRNQNGKTEVLDYVEAKKLLQEAQALSNLSIQKQQEDLKAELLDFDTLKPRFLELATQRADHLVQAHSRFKDLIGGRRYEKATPILPPDVMGIYILLPKPKRIA